MEEPQAAANEDVIVVKQESEDKQDLQEIPEKNEENLEGDEDKSEGAAEAEAATAEQMMSTSQDIIENEDVIVERTQTIVDFVIDGADETKLTDLDINGTPETTTISKEETRETIYGNTY
jgi:ElaB/YqjD/DUF883 family membrane-anchored ribosome-binding protein